MAKYSAKGATISFTITGTVYQVGADCQAFEIVEHRGLVEASGFGEPENYLEGQNVWEVNIDAWFGISGTTSGLFNNLRLAKANVLPVTISIKPNPVSQTFSGVFTFDGYEVKGKKKGDVIEIGTVSFKLASGNPDPTWS